MSDAILILCTGNSARSQMAEGILRDLTHGDREVHSAGLTPSTVHPLAVKVMQECGIDISHQRSEHVGEYLDRPFGTVITVCDHAAGNCPAFHGPAQRIHWSLPDPAVVEGTEEQRLEGFRRVRDQLQEKLGDWLRSLDAASGDDPSLE